MGKVWQRVLTVAAVVPVLAVATVGGARRFYPDDPIMKSPPPVPVKDAHKRKINLLYDFAVNSGGPPGEKQPAAGPPIRAMDVNTIDEVPDGDWYVNRHYYHRMSLDELRRGPGNSNQPVPPFTITGAKNEGISPGFEFTDARGRKYLAKSDPLSNPEMASAADVIGSKFFYAFGYYTPENYIAYFTRDDLKVSPEAKFTPKGGSERRLSEWDLDPVFDKMPKDAKGRYRVMASLFIEGKGIGPLRWYGVRTDDPNDIYPHEHRRTDRGLYVFCAWLNHTDIKALQTYDTVIETAGVPHIRHYLVDWGSMLGSDSDSPKDVRLGHRYMIDKNKSVLGKMFGAGLWIEDWETADYGDIPSVGRFTAEAFHPDRWTPNYPNAAFVNRLPDDEFWGAKQVMAFTNEEIRTIVETGEYSDPRAVDYLVGVLTKRRDAVGRTFFAKVLPLDRFEVRNGELTFHNLAVDYGFSPAPSYEWQWATFNNDSGQRGPAMAAATGPRVPDGSGYRVATIRASGDARKTVNVYLRGNKVVGIDRTW